LAVNPIPTRLADVEERLKQGVAASGDVVVRSLRFGRDGGTQALLVFVDGLIDEKTVNTDLLGALRRADAFGLPVPPGGQVDLSSVKDLLAQVVTIGEAKELTTFSKVEDSVLRGDAVLLIDGSTTALALGVQGWPKRGLGEPQTERTTRGPRLAFIEDLVTNVSLVRRELISPDLRVEYTKVGTRSPKALALVYLKGILNPAVLETARKRLAAIKLDWVASSFALEDMIQDSVVTPFPLIRSTERPDFAAMEMIRGKLVIFTDGTPFALIVPAALGDFMRTSEDYLHKWTGATLIRLVRYLGVFLTLVLAPGYIALLDVHPELVPTNLVISIAGSREGVPFPAVLEVAIMIAFFELLREATVRLPGVMGQTIGIVGGLVLGQAAVQAKLISDIMVIVISLTAVSSFAVPSFELAITWRILLFLFLVGAATLGIFGIVVAGLLTVAHLTSLTSFGMPYTAPSAPPVPGGSLDNFIRAPLRALRYRDLAARPLDKVRGKPYHQPAKHPDLRLAQQRAKSRGGAKDDDSA
jgi:hypothetical protein